MSHMTIFDRLTGRMRGTDAATTKESHHNRAHDMESNPAETLQSSPQPENAGADRARSSPSGDPNVVSLPHNTFSCLTSC